MSKADKRSQQGEGKQQTVFHSLGWKKSGWTSNRGDRGNFRTPSLKREQSYRAGGTTSVSSAFLSRIRSESGPKRRGQSLSREFRA